MSRLCIRHIPARCCLGPTSLTGQFIVHGGASLLVLLAVLPEVRFETPRMRGTLTVYGQVHAALRAIPAHAGNTLAAGSWKMIATGHPRACGEHSDCSRSIWFWNGPSPRMRGTLRKAARFRQRPRAIPAHAGNTTRTGWATMLLPGHPRACGEHTHDQSLLC